MKHILEVTACPVLYELRTLCASSIETPGLLVQQQQQQQQQQQHRQGLHVEPVVEIAATSSHG